MAPGICTHITKGSAYLTSEDQPKSQFLKVSRLNSIKTKIIVFAVLAAIIPSVSMWWVSYVQNRRFLSEKITQELIDLTAQVSREVDLWLKERLYDVRVFSSSYVVSENLERMFLKDSKGVDSSVALRQLMDYLRSVRGKFIAYEELALIDSRGKTVASSAGQLSAVKLPDKWLGAAQSGKPIIGEPYQDDTLQKAVMVIGEPIRGAQDRLLGVLVAKINFRTISSILRIYGQGETLELHLVTRQGLLMASSQSAGMESRNLSEATVRKLFAREKAPIRYTGLGGHAVIGTLKRVPQLEWGVVAEKNADKAYLQIIRLRNLTLLLITAVLLAIGLCAYFLGLAMVRPLGLLTRGASRVSAGDLEVDVPVRTRSEIGYLTEVFNHMVARLRQGREELANANEALREKNKELEQLSTTDSLTGLFNRMYLMEKLDLELARCARYQRDFTLLIIDIDHFKRYNDTYGHLAGDEVLRRMGGILKKYIRKSDCAARYGGEEFIVLLPETGAEAGARMAERIRRQMAAEKMGSDTNPTNVTISAGVASFPDYGGDPETLIRNGDAALYEAKRRGRNQIIIAGDRRKEKKRKAR
jgi:diguanylate cyclase (GGDEF)-like protein